MYDLIGDVHGHADELEALLKRLGYRVRSGAWRHPSRVAVFVGDFLDRGPKIRETLSLVRAMLEAGSAFSVLGNHEWNAFCFHTADPDARGHFLRRRGARNRMQHEATLAQVPPAELASHLSFLRSLPVRLELSPGTGSDSRSVAPRSVLALESVPVPKSRPLANVVHACWDEPSFVVIDEALARHGGLTDAFLVEGSNDESLLYAALEIVLKGKEMRLPGGGTFVDKDGISRTHARVRWFASPVNQSVATYTLPHFPNLPATPLPARAIAEARPYPKTAPPVFFGHYWLDDPSPAPLAENVFCLDYSVARGGFLCSYRIDEREFVVDDPSGGERTLSHS